MSGRGEDVFKQGMGVGVETYVTSGSGAGAAAGMASAVLARAPRKSVKRIMTMKQFLNPQSSNF